jgi:hypothetical protein
MNDQTEARTQDLVRVKDYEESLLTVKLRG